MSNHKRDQVANQCRVVAHLARCIADVHGDLATLFSTDSADNLIDQVGKRTTERMELLGDMLNGMDAADPQDKWVDPIFEEAQRLWPVKP